MRGEEYVGRHSHAGTSHRSPCAAWLGGGRPSQVINPPLSLRRWIKSVNWGRRGRLATP